ncbi:MAG: hypothetical protein M1303_03730 [Bacteroidetes bacterium]|nr:hypothetical protein [Bacteroidota bacterium]
MQDYMKEIQLIVFYEATIFAGLLTPTVLSTKSGGDISLLRTRGRKRGGCPTRRVSSGRISAYGAYGLRKRKPSPMAVVV